MSGETNLDILLKSMQPVLQDGIYVFHSSKIDIQEACRLNPVMTFAEKEGATLILKKDDADKAGLSYIFPSRMITLNVHSALDAVGFMAKITQKLAENGISVNPVSAYFHDHLFVPVDKAEQAMELLNDFGHG